MKTYTIKPLEEWGVEDGKYYTISMFGRYKIVYDINGYSALFLSWNNHTYSPVKYVDTLYQAKAAAEAHYIEQMEKGLEDAAPH